MTDRAGSRSSRRRSVTCWSALRGSRRSGGVAAGTPRPAQQQTVQTDRVNMQRQTAPAAGECIEVTKHNPTPGGVPSSRPARAHAVTNRNTHPGGISTM